MVLRISSNYVPFEVKLLIRRNQLVSSCRQLTYTYLFLILVNEDENSVKPRTPVRGHEIG